MSFLIGLVFLILAKIIIGAGIGVAISLVTGVIGIIAKVFSVVPPGTTTIATQSIKIVERLGNSDSKKK